MNESIYFFEQNKQNKMDRIIEQRKKQLNELKQIMKMQNLLEQYDRQNEYLNHQVDELLKQNKILKKSSLIKTPSIPSIYLQKHNDILIKPTQQIQFFHNYESNSKNSEPIHKRSNVLNEKRKSRYQYLFDEQQLTNLKPNITNEIKQINKNINPNNNLDKQEINIKSNKKNIINFQLLSTQPQLQHPSSMSQCKQQSLITQFKHISPLESNYSNLRQIKFLPEPIFQQNNQKNQNKDDPFSKKVILQQSNLFQQSFGRSDSKIVRFIPLTSQIRQAPSLVKQIDDSRLSNKFIPISLETKQQPNKRISTEKSLQSDQKIVRSTSSIKKNHSLHPSPKIQLVSSASVHIIHTNPFILKSQQKLQPQQHRHAQNSNIKRKFIKVYSSSKIKSEQTIKKN